jgi:hypothetical protein
MFIIKYVDIDLTIRLNMLDLNIWSKMNEIDQQYVEESKRYYRILISGFGLLVERLYLIQK